MILPKSVCDIVKLENIRSVLFSFRSTTKRRLRARPGTAYRFDEIVGNLAVEIWHNLIVTFALHVCSALANVIDVTIII